PVSELVGERCLLVGDRADGLVDHIGERRAILQRAEQHHIKLRRYTLGNGDRQAGFAHPAEAEDGHHPPAVVHNPLVERFKLALAAIQRGDGYRLAPVEDRVGRGRRRGWRWRRIGRWLLLAIDWGGLGCMKRQGADKPGLVEEGEWIWPILG